VSIKTRRLTRLRDILERQHLRSQEEIAVRLEREGIEATQATLSRDLRELGVLKGPDGYTLPQPGAAPDAARRDLSRALSAYMLSARPAASLIVIRTGPGQANALALEVDRASLHGAVGTVAGDDTIFIATESAAHAARLTRQLVEMAAGA
jgi:transcriptional regulator of arginine metabolism